MDYEFKSDRFQCPVQLKRSMLILIIIETSYSYVYSYFLADRTIIKHTPYIFYNINCFMHIIKKKVPK